MQIYIFGDMKPFLWHILTCFLLLGAGAGYAFSQNFDEGVEFYQKQQFGEAADIFNRIDTPEAKLFAGKSYLAMGQYLRAKVLLQEVDSTRSPALFPEAQYTAALVDFQIRQYGRALDRLKGVISGGAGNQLAVDSRQFYNELLNYLTLEQRRGAFQASNRRDVQYDLIRSAVGLVPWQTARVLLETYRGTLPPDYESSGLDRLEEQISDSLSYRQRNRSLTAPEGTIYDIGAALPLFEPGDPEFSVSQGLYFGYLLAIESFNENNSGVRAVLRHRDTDENNGVAHVLSDFAWNTSVDAILGPLFSGPASQMAPWAEQYQIPMLAPLANSDDLFSDNPYIFQANPTFATHGREMARHARNELGLDSLAIFVEQGSLGEGSAHAFRAEFEKLGGRVPYFFSSNLESEGYEIGEYTRHFTTDPVLIDSLNYQQVEGVYAPFTGQAASTLIDLLLVDLNALNPGMTVLGSAEWGRSELSEQRIGNREIYFTESFYLNTNSADVEAFSQRYRERFDMDPNEFAMIGYDSASYLLRTLGEVRNPALLKSALKTAPVYHGLISDIQFDGTHINQRVKVFRIDSDGEAIPVNR